MSTITGAIFVGAGANLKDKLFDTYKTSSNCNPKTQCHYHNKNNPEQNYIKLIQNLSELDYNTRETRMCATKTIAWQMSVGCRKTPQKLRRGAVHNL